MLTFNVIARNAPSDQHPERLRTTYDRCQAPSEDLVTSRAPHVGTYFNVYLLSRCYQETVSTSRALQTTCWHTTSTSILEVITFYLGCMNTDNFTPRN